HEQQRSGGAGYEKSGLDLTSYAGVMKGTKFGRMVSARPGKQQFNVVAGLARRPELRMPHSKKQLSSCDRSSIRRNAIVRDPSTSPTVNSKSRLNGAVDISCHIKYRETPLSHNLRPRMTHSPRLWQQS
ncbi:MAG: hypothetical protein WA801_11030, partial [Pseudolabrys sp.]